MKKVVVDTSVFMKIFLEEEGREKALLLFGYANKNNTQIFVPNLFITELLSVVRIKNLDFNEVYSLFEIQSDININIVNPTKDILEKALEISKIWNTKSGFPSIYDCIYHSLAIIEDCDFITADKKHYEKTKKIWNIKLLNNLQI